MKKKNFVFNLERHFIDDRFIVGLLYEGDTCFGYTLEPPYRSKYGAIPFGSYYFDLVKSPRFGRVLPRLREVPGRQGILIHAGNTVSDTRGCILLGSEFSFKDEYLFKSRVALEKLMDYLRTIPSSSELVLNVFDMSDDDDKLPF